MPQKPSPLGVVPQLTDTQDRATALELRAEKKPGDETLRVSTGYRMAPMVRRFRLVRVGGAAAEHECTSGRCEVGSHPSNDFALEDATVSRFHCEVRIEDQRALVKDLGSSNGTFIDGVRVREGYLKDGNVLTLGQLQLRFELGDKTSPVPVSDESHFGPLVGVSMPMRAAFSVLEKAARSEATVLLEGETGVGKTRAAQAIHEGSARASGPFLVVDCGAVPASLLEAELFGYEKGAFTGASARRLGVFEEADGGTVLLDEIGELPLELQPKLLRVLEDKQIRRLGKNTFTPLNIRLVAATHRDLRADVNAGRFRSDLYFRLAVVKVTLPPLRAHPEDLPALAKSLLERLGATARTHAALFKDAFFDSLAAGTWPGNVRELRNHLERCMVFEEPLPLGEAGAPEAAASVAGARFSDARQRAIDAFERQYLESVLARHHGKVAQAAVEAGVDRVYLYKLMRKHRIKGG